MTIAFTEQSMSPTKSRKKLHGNVNSVEKMWFLYLLKVCDNFMKFSH